MTEASVCAQEGCDAGVEWEVYFKDGESRLYCESHMHKLLRPIDHVEPLPGVGTHQRSEVIDEIQREAELHPPGHTQPDAPTPTPNGGRMKDAVEWSPYDSNTPWPSDEHDPTA